jgi:hypothetical protein
LYLFSPPDNDAVTYTNFYILQSYQREGQDDGSVFGGGELRMIDRPMPRRSLLLNYALPPTIAEYDHPDVRGYRPALRNRDDPNYGRLLDWIELSLVPTVETSDYGIAYDPPGRTAGTTQPTTSSSAPSTQPAAPTTQPQK